MSFSGKYAKKKQTEDRTTGRTSHELWIITVYQCLSVVPHNSVAEVSKTGNL